MRSAPHRQVGGRGFTLIELLTVIVIIGLISAFGLPALARILDSSKVSAGVNTLVTGVATARMISTSQQPPLGNSTGGGYSGAALIVTPAAVGELRVAINDQLAVSQGGLSVLEELNPSLNGYRDMEGLEFISQPAGTRLVGINRVGGVLEFIEAPFAIRFDENGQLAVGSRAAISNTSVQASLLVHYDSDVDGDYEISGTGSSRDAAWDDHSAPTATGYWKNYIPDFIPGEEKKTIANFDRLEAVAGVRVVRIDDVIDPADLTNWPREDYADVFFSRVTGVPTITRRPGTQSP